MKTISTRLNVNNNGINQSIPTKKSHKNHRNYDQAAGDINRNATVSQAEYERDACEEELYRLRYGIEKLLADSEQGDRRFTNLQNPFRTMKNKIPDLNNRRNESWLDQCSPSCRRWTRNRRDDYVHIPDEYTHHRVYNDRNYDIPLQRTPDSPLQSQSFDSTPPTPSVSSRSVDPNMRHTKSDLRRSIDNLIKRNSPIKTDVSDLLQSKGFKDPAYNSLILQILEAKALDCLCSGYSKQNTQAQIAQALNEINQRDDHHSDSVSYTSSQASPNSYETSSQASPNSYDTSSTSILSTDASPSPRIDSPPKTFSPSPLTSPDDTPHKIKSSLKTDEKNKSPKKKSKVTIVTDKNLGTKKAKNKKKTSSRNKTITAKQKQKSSKPTKKPSKAKSSSKAKKPSKTKSSSKAKKPSKTKSSSKTKKPTKKRSSSKSKKKSSSKSPSRSTSRKKQPSKKRSSSKKKKSKSKSNNHVNDGEILPAFIYPQSYQDLYRNH